MPYFFATTVAYATIVAYIPFIDAARGEMRMSGPRSIGKQITTLSRCLSKILDARIAHLGLTASTIPVLGFLYENEGAHQDALAEALQFDKSSAARAVARLERNGYVTKTVDPSNRRRNTLRATEKARSAKQEILRILKGLTDDIFSGFSEEEIECYYSLTAKMHSRVKHLLKD